MHSDPGDLVQAPKTGIPEKCWRGRWHKCWQKWGCCAGRLGPLGKQRQNSLPAPVPALQPAPPFLPAPVPAPPPALFWNSRFGGLCQVAGISTIAGLRPCGPGSNTPLRCRFRFFFLVSWHLGVVGHRGFTIVLSQRSIENPWDTSWVSLGRPAGPTGSPGWEVAQTRVKLPNPCLKWGLKAQLSTVVHFCGPFPVGRKRQIDVAGQKLPRDNFCLSLVSQLPSPRG